MRLYFPETLEQSPVMLLRGKSLERFVNGRWIPGQRHLRTETTQVEKEEPYGKVEQESMQTDTVFAPYGVRVAYDPDTFLPAPRRTGAGDWFIPGTLTKRKSYLWFPLKEERTGLPEPLPDKRLLEIPKLAQENRWRTTAERSFRSTKTTIEKVRRVQELLGRHEGVLFTEAPTIPSNEDALSHFFFTVKKGHCELFASSSAILLRMAGVPTRLVAGFRSVQNPGYRGLRLVKNTEAHVWVEYWDGQWKPFDPTPIILAPTSAFDFIEDSFDFVSRFWYRNIVSYEFTFGLWREYQGKLPWILGVLLAIKALFWFWRRKPKEQWQESKQRKQLSKLMDAIERLPQGEKKQTLQQEYEALRFGRVEPTAKDRKKLQEKIQAFS